MIGGEHDSNDGDGAGSTGTGSSGDGCVIMMLDMSGAEGMYCVVCSFML
jgi:hypothetical protein